MPAYAKSSWITIIEATSRETLTSRQGTGTQEQRAKNKERELMDSYSFLYLYGRRCRQWSKFHPRKNRPWCHRFLMFMARLCYGSALCRYCSVQPEPRMVMTMGHQRHRRRNFPSGSNLFLLQILPNQCTESMRRWFCRHWREFNWFHLQCFTSSFANASTIGTITFTLNTWIDMMSFSQSNQMSFVCWCDDIDKATKICPPLLFTQWGWFY